MANKININLFVENKSVKKLFLLQNQLVIAASNEPGTFSHRHFNVYWSWVNKIIKIKNQPLNVDSNFSAEK